MFVKDSFHFFFFFSSSEDFSKIEQKPHRSFNGTWYPKLNSWWRISCEPKYGLLDVFQQQWLSARGNLLMCARMAHLSSSSPCVRFVCFPILSGDVVVLPNAVLTIGLICLVCQRKVSCILAQSSHLPLMSISTIGWVHLIQSKYSSSPSVLPYRWLMLSVCKCPLIFKRNERCSLLKY